MWVCVGVGVSMGRPPEAEGATLGLTVTVVLGTCLDMLQVVLHLIVQLVHAALQVGQCHLVCRDGALVVCEFRTIIIIRMKIEDNNIRTLTLDPGELGGDVGEQLGRIVLQRTGAAAQLVADAILLLHLVGGLAKLFVQVVGVLRK